MVAEDFAQALAECSESESDSESEELANVILNAKPEQRESHAEQYIADYAKYVHPGYASSRPNGSPPNNGTKRA